MGIDIGKAGLVATIRVPSDGNPARRMQETRSFGTTKKEVLDKNLLGRYAFAPPAGPELRPLRDPASPGNDQ